MAFYAAREKPAWSRSMCRTCECLRRIGITRWMTGVFEAGTGVRNRFEASLTLAPRRDSTTGRGWIPARGNRNPNVIPRLLKEYLKIAKRNSWPSWPAHLCWVSLAVIPLWFVGYYLL